MHICIYIYICIYILFTVSQLPLVLGTQSDSDSIQINTGLCGGLHDGDACTFGSPQPCAAAGPRHCCVYCTDHHG